MMNHSFSVYFTKLQFDKLWKSSPPPLNACKSVPNLERLDLAICSVQNEMVWEESPLLSGLLTEDEPQIGHGSLCNGTSRKRFPETLTTDSARYTSRAVSRKRRQFNQIN